MAQAPAGRRARVMCRLVGLLAYGFVEIIYIHAQSTAFTAYNDVCSPEHRLFVQFYAPEGLAIQWMMLALPILLARSDLIIKANLIMSLSAAVFAVRLLFSAQTPPTECVSMGGTYEDRASGLDEFGLYLLLLFVLSYIFVLVDLFGWAFRRLVHAFAHGNEPIRAPEGSMAVQDPERVVRRESDV
jgi:hypothetical protein